MFGKYVHIQPTFELGVFFFNCGVGCPGFESLFPDGVADALNHKVAQGISQREILECLSDIFRVDLTNQDEVQARGHFVY